MALKIKASGDAKLVVSGTATELTEIFKGAFVPPLEKYRYWMGARMSGM